MDIKIRNMAVMKSIFYRVISLLSITLVVGCQHGQQSRVSAAQPLVINQAQLNTLANSLQVQYKFLSNIEADCPDKNGKKVEHCYGAEIWLTSPVELKANQFTLNYSQVYPVYASSSDDFTLVHINGDIHQISPKAAFTGFDKNKTLKIKLWVKSTY